ncbi:MAG TPA: spore coat protein CotJB, partial [Thermoanaerobacter sp.]|nr:spore coat protein CotJB [Thermoanaerobacter sp.]
MDGNQISLLKKIMEIEFTCIDLNLYLDTHP